MTKTRTFYSTPLMALFLAITALAFFAGPALAQEPVVDTAVDENDGECATDCSLRDAIITASPGDTITFDGDYTITLSSQLVISKNLTIDGEAHAITVSGNDAVRVFQVYTDTRVSFDSLTITHGQATTPEFEGNPIGGGVNIEAGAVVTLTNSALFSNTATYYDADNDEYYGHGGGVFNLGTLTVISTTFTDNVASGNPGGTEFVNGDGGAIHNRGVLMVQNSAFTGNAGDSGGAVYSGPSTTLTVQNSAFTGNAGDSGGAIYGSSATTLTVQNSAFTGNAGNDRGGAIYGSTGSMLTVQNSTVSSNSAVCGGAGIYNYKGTATVSDSTVADNVIPFSYSCESDAAGIGNYKGTLTVSRSTISGNINGSGSGGGLSSYNQIDQARVTVTDSSIYSNTAYSNGGGIYNWWDSVLTVTNSSIYSNTANWYGGGILSGGSQNTKLTLINSTLSHNRATGNGDADGHGGGLSNGKPDSFGGEVLTIINSTVVSNTAGGSYGDNSGGGFYNRNSANVTLDNLIIWGNSAATGPPSALATLKAPAAPAVGTPRWGQTAVITLTKIRCLTRWPIMAEIR